MGRITDLTILEEHTNSYSTFGIYWCKFKGQPKLFTRNGEVFKVLTHLFDHDEINLINDDVKAELLYEIEKVKSK